MKTFNWDRISQVHHEIKRENTGTPRELAHHLCMSKSLLFLTLVTMRELGFPIKYNRRLRTYFYTEDCDFITVRVATLKTESGNKRLV